MDSALARRSREKWLLRGETPRIDGTHVIRNPSLGAMIYDQSTAFKLQSTTKGAKVQEANLKASFVYLRALGGLLKDCRIELTTGRTLPASESAGEAQSASAAVREGG